MNSVHIQAHTQTDRHTHMHKQTNTHTHIDTQTDIHTDMHRHTDTHTHAQTNRGIEMRKNGTEEKWSEFSTADKTIETFF